MENTKQIEHLKIEMENVIYRSINLLKKMGCTVHVTMNGSVHKIIVSRDEVTLASYKITHRYDGLFHYQQHFVNDVVETICTNIEVLHLLMNKLFRLTKYVERTFYDREMTINVLKAIIVNDLSTKLR